MSTKVDLNQLEKKVWLRFFQDGIWELYLGLLLLIMGTSNLVENTGISEAGLAVIYLAAAVVAIVLFQVAKHTITRPRIGQVKFGPKGQTRRRKTTLLMTFSVLFGLVMFVLGWTVYQGLWRGDIPWKAVFPTVYAVWMLVAFSLGAYFLEWDRLYLIGVLYALPIPLQFLLRQMAAFDPGYWAFVIAALPVLILGVISLVRFVKQNPIQTIEHNHGS